MATTRIMPLHIGKGRTVSRAVSDIIGYVSNPEKTDNGRLITSYACDSKTADNEFVLAKKEYIQITGRERGKDDVIAYHLRQAFVPGEVTAEQANAIGVEFAKRFTKGNHAFVVCTHIDKAHIHNHIIWNAVNLNCDRKFRNFWGSSKAVRRLNDTLCIENGLSVVENPKRHGKSYNKWLGKDAVVPQREILRTAIDNALNKNPSDLEQLLKFLSEEGYQVNIRGKSISLKAEGWKKPARLDSLGKGYSRSELIALLSSTGKGNGIHINREPVNLLVDIQAKLQQGKGIGYERWAKVFNLKQMAKTVNFLTENGLLQYEDLAKKAEDISAEFNRLTDEIKSSEQRLSEIYNLKKQIINYSKTRDVYVAYRKSGYSKKFLSAHEEEILIHKAAKKTFDDLKMKKLPKVKNLNSEYTKVLEEKKKAYSEYHKYRTQMKDILTAKSNVDRILNIEGREEKTTKREDKGR